VSAADKGHLVKKYRKITDDKTNKLKKRCLQNSPTRHWKPLDPGCQRRDFLEVVFSATGCFGLLKAVLSE
jgi:hypothetical protein